MDDQERTDLSGKKRNIASTWQFQLAVAVASAILQFIQRSYQ